LKAASSKHNEDISFKVYTPYIYEHHQKSDLWKTPWRRRKIPPHKSIQFIQFRCIQNEPASKYLIFFLVKNLIFDHFSREGRPMNIPHTCGCWRPLLNGRADAFIERRWSGGRPLQEINFINLHPPCAFWGPISVTN
jgi:hypothetical protein